VAWPDGEPLVVADWGVRPLATDVLYVDHHAAPEPVSGTVLHGSSTGDDATSLLAWRLLGCPPERAWLAAVGVAGDLGERGLRAARLPVAAPAQVRRLATLATAPSRLRGGPVAVAYDILAEAESMEAALADARIDALEAARTEAARWRTEAMRVGPKVGSGAALITLDVPAKVHSQVATAWMRRLAPRVVVAANRGWRPGRVSFAVRCAQRGRDLRAWLLRVFVPAPGSGDYARGHAQATGGNLVPEEFERFAAAVLAAPDSA
jgi:single-stranded-DNA-specific exonuclease